VKTGRTLVLQMIEIHVLSEQLEDVEKPPDRSIAASLVRVHGLVATRLLTIQCKWIRPAGL